MKNLTSDDLDLDDSEKTDRYDLTDDQPERTLRRLQETQRSLVRDLCTQIEQRQTRLLRRRNRQHQPTHDIKLYVAEDLEKRARYLIGIYEDVMVLDPQAVRKLKLLRPYLDLLAQHHELADRIERLPDPILVEPRYEFDEESAEYSPRGRRSRKSR
jgi:hypothetical protein